LTWINPRTSSNSLAIRENNYRVVGAVGGCKNKPNVMAYMLRSKRPAVDVYPLVTQALREDC
jgi:hypothetical protein